MPPESLLSSNYCFLTNERFEGFVLQVPANEPVWKVHGFLKVMDKVFEVEDHEIKPNGSWLKTIARFYNKGMAKWKIQ